LNSASDALRLRLLAVAAGASIGVVGTAFRIGAERGYAAYAALLAAAPYGLLPGWGLGAISGAIAISAVVFLTRRFTPEAAGSGIQEIEGALAGVRPLPRWPRILPVKFFGGLLALWAGMVLGREGPTIHMGGSLATALASWRSLTRERANILIGAGSSAGLAVAFNAPLGGILFAMEELRREFPLNLLSAQCVSLATIAAILVSITLAGPARILPMPLYGAPGFVELGLTVPFAVLVGVYGVLFNAALVRTQDGFRTLTRRFGWLLPASLTGGGIGILVWAFADVTGGGEALTVRLLEAPPGLALLGVLLLARTVSFNVSYATGTPGGLFAPQLAFGTMLGLLFVGAVRLVAPDLGVEPGRFAVAGMAALLTATVRAPLTGLALVVEMTGNYPLLLMALLASVVADSTASALGGRPIYEVLLDRALDLAKGEGKA
jgi:CIC family chloride channel protein